MKKVVGIFMAMMMVFIVLSMAIAENPKGDVNEVYAMVQDWIRSQDQERYLRGDFEGGVYYTCGVISASEFKKLTGEEYSEMGLKKVYWNAKDYGADFNAVYVSIRLAGFIEGYDVYILDIKTETEPLGYYDGIAY